MKESNRTLAHEWYARVWNEGSEEAVDALFAADGIAHGIFDNEGNELRGPAGFKPFLRTFKGAFPDLKVAIEDTICEGDKVVVRYVARGTHDGDALGIAATGRPIEITGMAIVRVANGQIAEAWNNFDMQGLNTQLGLR
jgi:steroid delta-isomerase-like uncharacterized protein